LKVPYDLAKSLQEFLKMMSTNDEYQSPLNTRYCSEEMKHLFSPRKRFSTWRELWCILAESEKELGLEMPPGAVEQMREHIVSCRDVAHDNFKDTSL